MYESITLMKNILYFGGMALKKNTPNHEPIKMHEKKFDIKALFEFIKELYFSFLKNDMPALSAQLAYSFLFSFFPFIIFVVTLLSYTNIYSLDILQNYSYLLPDIVYEILLDIITKTASSRSQTALSFSIILTLWAASGGVLATMRGMNKAYKFVEHRSFWKIRWLSLLFTIALAMLLIVLLITLVLGEALGIYVFNYIFNYLGISKTSNNILLKNVWDIFRYILPIFSAFIIFLIVYRYMPSYKIPFKSALPGAIFSTIGWFALSLGFSYYVNNYASFSITYGSIGGVIALLIWLYWSSMIVLLGGEINSSITHNLHNSK